MEADAGSIDKTRQLHALDTFGTARIRRKWFVCRHQAL
jgi:hypothetical protein